MAPQQMAPQQMAPQQMAPQQMAPQQMAPQCRPLVEVLQEVPDFRCREGKRHPLPAVLALACAALLCGYRSYSAMAEWGHNYGAALAAALGFRDGKTPCAATFYNIFTGLDHHVLEDLLGQWAQSVLLTEGAAPGATPGASEPILGVATPGVATPGVATPGVALAVDGKTLRGSARQGAAEVHLLSAVSHHLGLTLHQRPVADKSNEITAAQAIVHELVLRGRILTVDALLTQRSLCQEIVAKGGTT